VVKSIFILTLAGLISGCSVVPTFSSFESQACMTVYCEDTEYSAVKKAGLKLMDLVFKSQGINLELGRGFCEKYYTHRSITNGYIYLRRSAKEVCQGL